MPVLTSSVLVHSSNLDSTRKLLAPSLRRPASGIFSLHARGESRLIKERSAGWSTPPCGLFRVWVDSASVPVAGTRSAHLPLAQEERSEAAYALQFTHGRPYRTGRCGVHDCAL